MTFSGKIFFLQKCLNFACAFILSSKPFPGIFLAGTLFLIEAWNLRVFLRKNTGECFSIKLKSTCKNSGTFERKKILPKKVLTSLLHQAIQLSV